MAASPTKRSFSMWTAGARAMRGVGAESRKAAASDQIFWLKFSGENCVKKTVKSGESCSAPTVRMSPKSTSPWHGAKLTCPRNTTDKTHNTKAHSKMIPARPKLSTERPPITMGSAQSTKRTRACTP